MSEAILEAPGSGAPETLANPVEQAISALKERFPEAVVDDPRDGYSGLVVSADKLTEIALALRDDLGFDYLSSVTGVDLIEDGKLEAVYHTYSIDKGGSAVVLHVQVDRDNPVIPSLVPVWPGADFQEREAWDLLGIQFDGHPDLRRILTWDGFHGHPLRKDWK
ncbi:MAG: NADH-quinone oxidoreductase subunit C, partial [Candidatus Promineifilaceae bacterium]